MACQKYKLSSRTAVETNQVNGGTNQVNDGLLHSWKVCCSTRLCNAILQGSCWLSDTDKVQIIINYYTSEAVSPWQI